MEGGGKMGKSKPVIIMVALLAALLAGGVLWYVTRDAVNDILDGKHVPTLRHEEMGR